MTDRIKDLLGEVADGVEPGDRLDAIRSATASEGRTGRGWWAAGGVGLLAASVVTALALSTGGTPQGSDPAGTADADDRRRPDPIPDRGPVARPWRSTTSATPRPGLGSTASSGRAHRADSDGLSATRRRPLQRSPPLDPDYRSLWPDGRHLRCVRDANEELITVTLEGDLHDRPPGMTEAEARLAIEQVIRTAQGSFGQGRIPVQLLLNDARTDQVLGVPTSEPLAAGSDLEVLAHVSISNPSEGLLVDNDRPFTVKGVGNSYEGNVVTRIQRWEGTYVVDQKPTIAGTYEDRLFPFEVTFDLTGVAPGDYVVISQTDDPSGAGCFHIDTRRITVVD